MKRTNHQLFLFFIILFQFNSTFFLSAQTNSSITFSSEAKIFRIKEKYPSFDTAVYSQIKVHRIDTTFTEDYTSYCPVVLFDVYKKNIITQITIQDGKYINVSCEECNEPKFLYLYTPKILNHIKRINKAMEKDGGVKVDVNSKVYTYKIRNSLFQYIIEINSTSSFGRYRISKIGLRITARSHKHKANFR